MKKIIVCAPSRIYCEYQGGRFSFSAMVDYFSEIGAKAIDMSFDTVDMNDDSRQIVLYVAARRAADKNISIPTCHLPFYMPDPSDRSLMARFSRELCQAIDMASLMKITYAVTHPIALHSSRCCREEWLRSNVEFLKPIAEYARAKNIVLCIENMASRDDQSDHLYGCRAEEILEIADKIGTDTCFDVGHANISGLVCSEEMQKLGDRMSVLHIHDNDGRRDSHGIPFTFGVDWDDVANGIRLSGFCGVISVETTAWALPPDNNCRTEFGKKTLAAGERLISLANI